MTTIEEALALGFDSLLSVGGRVMAADTGESVSMIVEDAPELAEPMDMPKAKSPIYARLSCRAASVAAPYTVKTFTESGTTKIYTVLKYEEDLMGVSQQWLCEKQR